MTPESIFFTSRTKRILAGLAMLVAFSCWSFMRSGVMAEWTDLLADQFCASDFSVFGPISPADLRMVFDPSGTTARQALSIAEGSGFAVNGPYFQTLGDGSFAPAGVLVRYGEALGKIDSDDPNLSAAFLVDSRHAARICTLDTICIRELRESELGFQAGPMLVHSGAAVVTDDASWHAAARYPRTAIGLDADGKIWLFAAPAPSSLREFATRIRREVPGIVDAVNLDGGPSTAYAATDGRLFRSHRNLPYFLMSSNKSPE